MLTRKGILRLLILLMAVGLVISACDRPFPSSENNNGATETNENDSGYPNPTVGLDNTAVEEGQTDSTPEPSRAVAEEGDVESEEPPAEGSEEVEEDGSSAEPSDAEVPAEATDAAPPAEEGEAEVTPEAGEAETPAEGDEEAAEEEVGEADPTPASEAEAPAEADGEQEAEPVAVQPLPATHTVAAGENLYRIGLQYGISWVAIAEANGLTNADRIYAGQVLNIPGSGTGGQPEPMPTPEGINYIVKPGDTLFKIAQRFGISWVEIAEANGLVNPDEIYAGQMIKIPVDAPTPPPVVHHVVQPGETLFRISLRYGLPWLAIANANHIGPPYIIYAGQTLVIPGGH